MKRFFFAVRLAVSLATLPGCATDQVTGQQSVVTPKTPTQTVYALEVSLTAAANALADLHAQKIVVGANYATAIEIEKRAHATLIDARAAATAKDATRATVLLHTLSGLIDQLALYNGGKK